MSDNYRNRARTIVYKSAPSSELEYNKKEKNKDKQKLLKEFDDVRSKFRRLELLVSKKSKKKKKTATLTRSTANIEETLSKELEDVYNELNEKEKNLNIAAELGSSLVNTVEVQTENISQLEEEIKQRNLEMDMMREDRKSLKKKVKRLELELEESQLNYNDEKSKNKTLHDNIVTLKKVRSTHEDQENTLAVYENQLKSIKLELSNLMREHGKIKEENRELHETIQDHRDDKVNLMNQTISESLILDYQKQIEMLETKIVEKDKLIDDLKSSSSSSSKSNTITSRHDTITSLSIVEDIEKYRLTNVESEIPPEAFVLRAMNIFNALLLIGLSLSLLFNLLSNDKIPNSIAISYIIIGMIWLIYEAHSSKYESIIQNRYMPFFSNIYGRIIFHLLITLLVIQVGDVGIAIGIYSLMIMLGNIYILWTYPDLKDRYIKVALIIRNKTSSKTKLTNDDNNQMLGAPLLDDHNSNLYDSAPLVHTTDDIINKSKHINSRQKFTKNHKSYETKVNIRKSDEFNDDISWIKEIDESTGRAYFLNTKSGETRFS